MKPATIKIFLVNGNPESIRTAELSNWTGKAIAGPRSELADLLKREELVKPGVYFLTGVDPALDQPSIYIGEAESVKKRLSQHQQKDDWSQVVAFVSKDENLTKAHIRYLEGALITLANKAGRAKILNNASSGAKLPESDKADMDVYLDKLIQLLPVMGIELFKLIEAPPPNDEAVLYCRIKGLVATGNRSSGGFIVYKGSRAVLTHRASATTSKRRREGLMKNGVLVPEGDCLVFSRDYEFGSPGQAASSVRGGGTNGLTSWENSKGDCLRDLEAGDA